jgi:hypothetical protein
MIYIESGVKHHNPNPNIKGQNYSCIHDENMFPNNKSCR